VTRRRHVAASSSSIQGPSASLDFSGNAADSSGSVFLPVTPATAQRPKAPSPVVTLAMPHIAVLHCSIVQQLLVVLEDSTGGLLREEASSRAVKLAELSGLVAASIAHLVPSTIRFQSVTFFLCFSHFCSCESVHAFMLVLHASFGVLVTMHEQHAYAHECFGLFRVVNTLPALILNGSKLLRGTVAPKYDA
jgi:hypothetical protein